MRNLGKGTTSRYNRIGIATLAIVLVLSSSLAKAVDGREEASLLDRSVEEIKKDVATAGQCEWTALSSNHWRCQPPHAAPFTYPSFDLNIESPRGTYLRIVPETGGISRQGLELTHEAVVMQAIAIESLARLFPSWTDSRAWLSDTLVKARRKNFEAAIRVAGTSIYVAQGSYVDRDYAWAEIVLTKDVNVAEFRGGICSFHYDSFDHPNCTADFIANEDPRKNILPYPKPRD